MHLHAGSKPFKCPYCTSKFNLKGNLSRHMKVKHGIMDSTIEGQGSKHMYMSEWTFDGVVQFDSPCTADVSPSPTHHLPTRLVNISVAGLATAVLFTEATCCPTSFREQLALFAEDKEAHIFRVLSFFRTPPGDRRPGGVRGGGFWIQRARKPGKQQQHTRHG